MILLVLLFSFSLLFSWFLHLAFQLPHGGWKWEKIFRSDLPGNIRVNHNTIIMKPCRAGINLCMRPANERRRYTVTPSLIGWAHTQNGPWWWNRYCSMIDWGNGFVHVWHHPEQPMLTPKKMCLKLSFAQFRPFCSGLKVLKHWHGVIDIWR